MRFLLREVARRLSFLAGQLQGGHPTIQRLRGRFQRLNPPVRRPLCAGEQPPDPRRHGSRYGADQLGGDWGEVKLVHEDSMRAQDRDDTHASGAYIIGQMRFPPPFGGMFTTTVPFGHTSAVAPSDVPSVFSSG